MVTRWVEQPLHEGARLRVRAGVGVGLRLRNTPAAAEVARTDRAPRTGDGVSAEPSFVLGGPDRCGVRRRIVAGYRDVAAAAAALRTGSARIILAPCLLTCRIRRPACTPVRAPVADLPDWAGEVPHARIGRMLPEAG